MAAFHERVARRAGRARRGSWSSSTTARATPRRALLAELAAADERVKVVTLSRNFGHQAALTAGLDHARGDAVVMLDGDLQDPPEVIPEMLARWRAGRRRGLRGARVRARARRAFKLLTARWFYRLFAPAGATIELTARRRRLPADGPPRARRAARHARAQPLPARHDRLGRLHADRGASGARRAAPGETKYTLRGCCASPSTRSRSSRTRRCSWRRCSASSARCSPSSRIPLTIVARYANIYERGVPTTIVDLPAARRHPADHASGSSASTWAASTTRSSTGRCTWCATARTSTTARSGRAPSAGAR